MKNFVYYSPTEVVFGKDVEYLAGEKLKKAGAQKVLLHYGGQSALKNGLIDRLRESLKKADVDFIELGGAMPNPRLSLAYTGIELCKKENVDYILAVGGGSAIDSAKCIAYGAKYDGDVWDFYEIGGKTAVDALPVGVVLTMVAAGSELSDSSVITKNDGMVKRGYSSDLSRPKFALMNPELTYTLPMYQSQCGTVDIMMHTMERYFSLERDTDLTDAIAEAILVSTMNSGKAILHDPKNYQFRADMMWAGSLSHNGLTGIGRTGDWATHKFGHELSGLFDVAHGASLSAVWGSWARYVLDSDVERFAKYAVDVMKISNSFFDQRRTALDGIEATEGFFKYIGMPTTINDLLSRKLTDDEIEKMADQATGGDTITLGGMKTLKKIDMINIYNTANKK